jgi:hypothetical protein
MRVFFLAIISVRQPTGKRHSSKGGVRWTNRTSTNRLEILAELIE